MASSKEITITVKGKITRVDGESSGSIAEKKVEEGKEGNSDGNTTLAGILNFARSPIKSTLGKNAILLEGYNQTKRLIVQTANTLMNRYFDLKEDYMAQNSATFAKAVIGRVAQYGTAMVAGALTGAKVAGVPGAIIGAAISTVGTAFSNYINFQAELSAYNEQYNATNIQTGYSRLRAGLVDGGRGTEN